MPLPSHLDRTPHMRAIAAGALLATALLTSIAIMLTVTLGAAPKVAAQEPVTDEIQTLVSNVDARDVDDDTINVNLNGTAQVFRTGPQLGIRLDSIDVKFGTSVDKKYIVLNAGLHAVNDDGSRGARLTGFSYGDKKNNQMNRFWARDQVELEPSTAYMFVITCTAGCANNNYLNIRRVSDNAEDEGSAEGWSIDDGRILSSDNWTPKPRTHSLKISVQGTSGHPPGCRGRFRNHFQSGHRRRVWQPGTDPGGRNLHRSGDRQRRCGHAHPQIRPWRPRQPGRARSACATPAAPAPTSSSSNTGCCPTIRTPTESTSTPTASSSTAERSTAPAMTSPRC